MKKPEYYIGLMSGTSVDSVDAGLVDLSDDKPQLLASHHHDFPPNLRTAILKLFHSDEGGINHFAKLDVEIGLLFAEAANTLLKKSALDKENIIAIGSHGQTVRHYPNLATPFTLQIGDPNIIAARTGITTVADFRRKDIANGGQGAPFVPVFHHFLREKNQACIMLNIGGIANISYLPANKNQAIIGFDTGPGNGLSDAWCAKNLEKKYDAEGEWAASGQCDKELLDLLLKDPYFSADFPKSTGKEYFNLIWLEKNLQKFQHELEPETIQATLVELTVKTIADAINKISPPKIEVFICGGGTHNTFLMHRLAKIMSPRSVNNITALNVDPDWVEAMAFAWFAKQTLNRQKIDMTRITGAKIPAVLGGIYYP